MDRAKLKERKASLEISLEASISTYLELKERLKVVKKEIVNAEGALNEIDKWLSDEV
jgi:hypothetical protein